MTAGALFVVTDAVTTIFLRGQVQHLEQLGLRCAVVSSPGEQAEELRRAGVTVESAPLRREPAPLHDLRSLVRLVRLMRARRPALVNASTPKAGILGMVAAFTCRVPVRVYQCRGLRFEMMGGRSRTLYRAIERTSARLATHVLFNSESLRRTALTEGVGAPEKAHVAGHGSSNGVDLDRFRPDEASRRTTRAGLGIADDAPVLGFVGRVVREKGIEALVGAFNRLRHEHPGLRLLVVGGLEDGDPVDEDVRRTIESDDDIVLTGFVADTAAFYRAMDVLVFPSWREGLPNAPLEAQASGVPVVAFAATGTVDAVADGVGGRLVPLRDDAALAAAVDALLRDGTARAAMGEVGRQWVAERFDQRRVWDGVGHLYRRWLEDAGVG